MQPAERRSPLLWVPTGYFTMALAYTMLCSVTAIMFKNLGMDDGRAAAWSSMLILAYTIKPLFATVVEMLRTKKFFVLWAQVLVGLGFAGATQDIASDGVYVTSLDSRAQSLYCGVQSLSWNVGPIVASGFLAYLSGRLHADGFHHDPRVFGPDWMDGCLARDLLHRRRHHPADGAVARALHARGGARSKHAIRHERRGGHPEGFLRHLHSKAGHVEDGGLRLPVPAQHRLPGEGRAFLHGRCRGQGGLGLSNEQLGIVYATYGLAAVLLGSLLGGWSFHHDDGSGSAEEFRSDPSPASSAAPAP